MTIDPKDLRPGAVVRVQDAVIVGNQDAELLLEISTGHGLAFQFATPAFLLAEIVKPAPHQWAIGDQGLSDLGTSFTLVAMTDLEVCARTEHGLKVWAIDYLAKCEPIETEVAAEAEESQP